MGQHLHAAGRNIRAARANDANKTRHLGKGIDAGKYANNMLKVWQPQQCIFPLQMCAYVYIWVCVCVCRCSHLWISDISTVFWLAVCLFADWCCWCRWCCGCCCARLACISSACFAIRRCAYSLDMIHFVWIFPVWAVLVHFCKSFDLIREQ